MRWLAASRVCVMRAAGAGRMTQSAAAAHVPRGCGWEQVGSWALSAAAAEPPGWLPGWLCSQAQGG